MGDKESGLPWGYMLASAFLGVIGTVAAGLLLPIFTDRQPDLIYDISPPANFSSTAVQLSILDSVVQNVGKREAEDVTVYLSLAETQIQELVIRPSSKTLTFTQLKPPNESERVVKVPRLNPGESVKFSLLINTTSVKPLTVEVSGKGVTGRKSSEDSDTDIDNLLRIIGSVIAGTAFALLAISILRSWMDRQLLRSVRASLNASSSNLRVATAALETASGSLEKIIVGPTYRLVFNPKTRDSKLIRFGAGGEILAGANKNENRWRIRDGFLELIDVTGGVHSRFVYNVLEQKFEQLLDEEQGSFRKHNILGQYIVREPE